MEMQQMKADVSIAKYADLNKTNKQTKHPNMSLRRNKIPARQNDNFVKHVC